TFVGQGEPLLCAGLGELIRQAKALTDIPIAVITNGSLLFLPEVRAALYPAAIVLPSLDAADEATFRRLNRPWPRLHLADIMAGLVAFRDEFEGQLWVEVMLVKGLNDSEGVLSELAAALRRVRPDQIHLNVPIRPPAEAWVEAPDQAGLIRAIAILGQVATLMTPTAGAFHLDETLPVEAALVEIIRRHPLRETELIETLDQAGQNPAQVQATLARLAASEQVYRQLYRGQAFWRFAGRPKGAGH
nr:radical SAM protein [Anaerolineae bacterium]